MILPVVTKRHVVRNVAMSISRSFLVETDHTFGVVERRLHIIKNGENSDARPLKEITMNVPSVEVKKG
jgi:hypothetical protein